MTSKLRFRKTLGTASEAVAAKITDVGGVSPSALASKAPASDVGSVSRRRCFAICVAA